MKRKLVFVILFACLFVATSIKAQAAQQVFSISPSLNFEGTSARCMLSVMDSGKSISATVELWQGGTLIDSWSDTGTSYLCINETHSVISGQTYTMVAYGTIGNTDFEITPITRLYRPHA